MATNITEWREEILPDVPKCPAFTIDTAVLRVLRDFCEHTKIWTERLIAIQVVAYTCNYPVSSSNGDIVGIDHVKIGTYKLDPITEDELDAKVHDWRNATASLPQRYFMDHDRSLRLVYTPNESSDVYSAFTDLTFSASGKTISSAAGGFTAAGLLAGQTIDISGSSLNNREVKAVSVTDKIITVEGGLADEGSGDASATLAVNGLHVWVAIQPTLTATTIEDFIYQDYLEVIADGARAKLFSMVNQPWANGEYANYFGQRYKAYRNKAANKKRTGLTKASTGGIGA